MNQTKLLQEIRLMRFMDVYERWRIHRLTQEEEGPRAKGQDHMTVVYDLGTGQLILVHEGRTSEILSMFLKQLPDTTKQGILAVAMDMRPAYQKSVKDDLPNADIIFDRFHVMQNFSRAIDNQRRIEFRKANNSGKELIIGTQWKLL